MLRAFPILASENPDSNNLDRVSMWIPPNLLIVRPMDWEEIAGGVSCGSATIVIVVGFLRVMERDWPRSDARESNCGLSVEQ